MRKATKTEILSLFPGVSLVLLLGLWPLQGAAFKAPRVEILYIDANVGSSSGGHVALRLEDEVYHFQNEQGTTRLTRDDWSRFRWVYNDIENRNIETAQLQLRPLDADRLRQHLGLLFIAQQRQTDYLKALEEDISLLETLKTGGQIPLKERAFFEPKTTPQESLESLRHKLTEQAEPDFLTQERGRLLKTLRNLHYDETLEGLSLKQPPYPAYPPTFSEKAGDLFTRELALKVIDGEERLRQSALIDAGPIPSSATRQWLQEYLGALEETIIQGLLSPYPGGGGPLLLALARHQSVALSLARNRLFFLSLFEGEPRQIEANDQEQQRLEALFLNQLTREVMASRAAIFAQQKPNEWDYHRMEIGASEINELESAQKAGRAADFKRTPGPPRGEGQANLSDLLGIGPSLNAALTTAKARRHRFWEWFDDQYGYQLITHNCVTELNRAIQGSFKDSDERLAFGGHIDPLLSQSFVPYRYFELVRQRYRPLAVIRSPSYRNRQLAALSDHGEDIPIALQESNTLTGTLYRARPKDGRFLFFTEQPAWTRPLFGTANLIYAMAAIGQGLVSLPTDEGRDLESAVSGILFSLPELGGWTIRKGSYTEAGLRAQKATGHP